MICWILLDVCSTTVLIQLPSLKWEGRQEMLLLEMILNLEQLYSVKIIFMHGIVIVIILKQKFWNISGQRMMSGILKIKL